MHEFAAYPWFNQIGFGSDALSISQWHEASNPGKMFDDTTIQGNPDKLVSPVLFMDGHDQRCDFTTIMKRTPRRGLEPGKDWMWYKLKR